MRSRIVYGRNGKKTFYIDDVEVSQKVFDKHFPSKINDLLASSVLLPAHTTTCWPMKSEALAVQPKQIEQARDRAKRHGIPTDFDTFGRPIFTSRGHRKEYMRMEGVHDNHGGYGD